MLDCVLFHVQVKLEQKYAATILAILVLEGLERSLESAINILDDAARPFLLSRVKRHVPHATSPVMLCD